MQRLLAKIYEDDVRCPYSFYIYIYSILCVKYIFIVLFLCIIFKGIRISNELYFLFSSYYLCYTGQINILEIGLLHSKLSQFVPVPHPLHRFHRLGSKEIKSPVTFSHLTFDYSAKLSYNKEYMIK